MIGGLAPSALKKLNGAAFKCPSRLSEVTHAMGLRVTSDRAPSRPGRDRSKRLELKQADKSSLEIDGKNPVVKGVEDGRVGNRQQLNFWVSRYNKNPLADFMAPQADSAAFCGG